MPIVCFHLQVKKQMEGSSSLLQQLGFSEYDLDDVKQLVSETSLKMLALTYETKIAYPRVRVWSFVRVPSTVAALSRVFFSSDLAN